MEKKNTSRYVKNNLIFKNDVGSLFLKWELI